MLAYLGVRRLFLSRAEYLTQAHFPGVSTSVTTPPDVDRALGTGACAALSSVVGWEGEVQPLGSWHAEIRKRLGSRAPLLIADYSHGGAIGLPAFESLAADIVCGEVSKWLLPSGSDRSLTFIWCRTSALQRAVESALGGFYLAVGGEQTGRKAR